MGLDDSLTQTCCGRDMMFVVVIVADGVDRCCSRRAVFTPCNSV